MEPIIRINVSLPSNPIYHADMTFFTLQETFENLHVTK